ncbi:hypothetical protein GALMADRAFT_1350302 [Galerina marginata CBS 339.88]|uniref:Uncharacterized protein n=1 Tax=Galerina marginata (strain CBS 339.88) TaxID=685588 RepID=A0A067SHN9_GALM3|nr:hypothetical protein GALMADRAFT_1350302 [Galerina marginata CBS 339.88]
MDPQGQTLDDSDPLISYSNANWVNEGTVHEYNNTVKYTNTAGAIVTFNFRAAKGTSVGVYGSIAPIGSGIPPQSFYSIDGGPGTFYNATMLVTTQYQKQFFLSENLSPNAPHSLVIKTMAALGHFYLDFITVTPVDGVPVGGASVLPAAPSLTPSSTQNLSIPPRTSPSLTASTSTPPDPALTSPAAQSLSTTPTSSSSTTSASASGAQAAAELPERATTTLNKGVIAVIIVGVLAIVFVMILLLRRRRKRALKNKESGERDIPSSWIQSQSSPISSSSANLMNPSQMQSTYSNFNAISPFDQYPQPAPLLVEAPRGGKGAIMHAGLQYVPTHAGTPTWSTPGSMSSGHARTSTAGTKQNSTDPSQRSVSPLEPPPPQYNEGA